MVLLEKGNSGAWELVFNIEEQLLEGEKFAKFKILSTYWISLTIEWTQERVVFNILSEDFGIARKEYLKEVSSESVLHLAMLISESPRNLVYSCLEMIFKSKVSAKGVYNDFIVSENEFFYDLPLYVLEIFKEELAKLYIIAWAVVVKNSGKNINFKPYPLGTEAELIEAVRFTDHYFEQNYSELDATLINSTEILKKFKHFNEGVTFSKLIKRFEIALLNQREPTQHSGVPIESLPVCIMHGSVPYQSGGYATRAHGLLSQVKEQFKELRCFTRPNFPYDLPVKKKFKRGELPASVSVDNVEYYLTQCIEPRVRSEANYIYNQIDIYKNILIESKATLVHGRSAYLTALPALIAARELGLPFIYEVSGLWEVVHDSRNDAFTRIELIKRQTYLETLTANNSDAVFTLTGGMKDELLKRGVTRPNIELVPNSTNVSKFHPCEPDLELKRELSIDENEVVIGYVGSFQDYEGLEDLVSAFELLSEEADSPPVSLLLVGDGPAAKHVHARVAASPMANKIKCTGRVSHDVVNKYYSLIDITPFPRKGWQVCEMVSPMKPLEALALEKAVVVSGVKALSEMVVDGVTGLIFQTDSVESLKACLLTLAKDKELRASLGAAGRVWVEEHRSWDRVVQPLLNAYDRLN